MKKHYLTAFFIVMISALVISCGGKKVMTTAPSFEPYKFNANQYVPKVDSFVVILDTSYSMADKYGNKAKANVAKEFLGAMNQTIPEMNYNGALRTFGNIAYVPDKSTLLVYGPTKYSTEGFGTALNAVKGSNGDSSRALAKAISAAGGDLKSAQGPVNVVIVSDGEDMDQIPVKAAEALKSQFGDRLCIFTVLIGDSPAGKDILDQIAKAGGCGYSTTADQLASSGDMAGFVEGIFLAKPAPKPAPIAKPMDSDGDGVIDNKDKCPNTPMGATVDARGCWTYAAVVLFDFDSAEIKSEAHPMLDEAVVILKKNPELKVEVDGHTDNIGPAEYNMMLSERRANAVMKYFVDNGVEAERLTVKGFGLTKPAVGNDTKEDRAKNRRVELTPVK
ncbi:MAG: OmpA family protein [Deltaproteobacteria bacterium]|nr:OmpA family protein [Deltaproteobacteria bacterium]MBW2157544.1 OmpA family protein [Deltaproteobacteria bacterium]MBW2228614.1 OmpA family protein [Deltaproteobacteria bacterium]